MVLSLTVTLSIKTNYSNNSQERVILPPTPRNSLIGASESTTVPHVFVEIGGIFAGAYKMRALLINVLCVSVPIRPKLLLILT
jgi:hypothetical protein